MPAGGDERRGREAVTDTITEAGKTGHIGDGKIFVLDLEEAIRIRTGERVRRPCSLGEEGRE